MLDQGKHLLYGVNEKPVMMWQVYSNISSNDNNVTHILLDCDKGILKRENDFALQWSDNQVHVEVARTKWFHTPNVLTLIENLL